MAKYFTLLVTSFILSFHFQHDDEISIVDLFNHYYKYGVFILMNLISEFWPVTVIFDQTQHLWILRPIRGIFDQKISISISSYFEAIFWSMYILTP